MISRVVSITILVFAFCGLTAQKIFVPDGITSDLQDFSSHPTTNLFFQDDDDDDDDGYDTGIPIFGGIQVGPYFANKASAANYYNGTAEDFRGQLIIQNIFDNPNSRRDIMDVTGLSDSDLDNSSFDFNYNMNYDIGFLVGFQGYFGATKNMWIMFDINFVQLNISSLISLLVDDPNIPNKVVTKMPVHGQEQRFIIDLGAHWILGKNSFKGYIETGVNLLSSKVKNNEFDVLDQHGNIGLTYSLMPTTVNRAANTIVSYNVGAFLGGGMFYKAGNKMGIEAGLQIGYNQVKLPGYEGYFPTYLISIRFLYLGEGNKM
jgi:hypothetical protein